MATRNSQFRSWAPVLHLHSVGLSSEPSNITGPFKSLNPTRAHYEPTSTDQTYPTSHWTSRNNRKGRHALIIPPATQTEQFIAVPTATTTFHATAKGIWRMCTDYPVWDISYDVAVIFTFGSIVWVLNAFFVFLPYIKPSTEFADEILVGGGVTAFVGATIFEVGSILLIIEAINENRVGCFGWAVERAVVGDSEEEKQAVIRFTPSRNECAHHHANRRNFVGKGIKQQALVEEKDVDSPKSSLKTKPTKQKSWTWLPTLHDLRSHYMLELGFLASLTQLFAASIFWIAGFTALPGISNHMSPGLIDGIYWTPQVIGGLGFIISGLLFMVETQSKWWKPAFGVLGWHIGFWNFIGGLGFFLSPVFGYDAAHWAQYQAACSTFWGSWAFLIGSAVQWFESLSKYSVEVAKAV